MNKIKVAIASDHAGFQFKNKLGELLKERGYEIMDFGCDSEDSMDYPDTAHPLAEAVAAGKFKYGFTLCGSGNGITMTANKHQEIRAALCWNAEIAELARLHNDANVCGIPARFISFEEVEKIASIFLSTDFEGGRHQNRVDKIAVK
ncbi:ribose 5-phosphate isomerase B [Labilibaculum sp. DW002]|uniref:Ribose 5-phosphate isomerase B n=1 Tax=Paralabilibaculum antarcticum TaxID=2912572 RepID=A0ABT5VWY9_9BACT|nr:MULTISPECIES: ribose 5-phosphate isomerase B [unclassified Labilibaculum]MBI9056614.1 ribose 5-phosphate isomerase B [Labilibaculum sp.]MDE5419936.1 ribose 5-phosphate isomerase B [Labilibaculum sp. DW002]|eukprot:TRINITY_DN145_c0_g2_i1.p2 TRINITY_DN145_c0_g2~~TRINITY_DN145_c0_g2_i1.p2  ORF type:complete len:147 (+),score=33.54 TRINITY_DN145_c0_g2_i1:94-534(+)